MRKENTEKLLGTYVIAVTVAITLFVSPWNSIDPVNLPKMVLLGVLAVMSIAFIFSGNLAPKSKRNKWLFVSFGTFLMVLVIDLLTSSSDFAFKFYGTPSRNTGFLAYLSLALIALVAAVSSSAQTLKRFSITLLGVGTFLGVYGLAQSRGIDAFDYVNAYGSDVFGTFGNPNFQSAFMGMVGATALTWLVFGKVSWRLRSSLILLVIISLLNVRLSSEQGYLNLLAGSIAGLIVFLFSTKKIKLGWSVLGASSAGGILILMGIFNAGPLADFIYKSSLQARGFYWRAAINMMAEHPLLGVGLDGFGNWYRRSRTQAAAELNAGVVSDTAHNIPLDLGSSGGFPLLLSYFGIILLALISIIRVIRRSDGFDVAFASIVVAWVAYQAQSLISINQLGIGVWGWVLTGLLIGYEFNTRNSATEVQESKKRHKFDKAEKLPASVLLATFIAGLIGLGISLPPYLAANKFYKALQSGDAAVLQQSAYLKPYDRTRFIYTAQILASNKLETQAIQILSDASEIYPDNFEIWQQWSQIPSATPDQVSKAKAEMKRLDPFNPDLK